MSVQCFTNGCHARVFRMSRAAARRMTAGSCAGGLTGPVGPAY
jgi:hypothetical protein